MHCRLPAIFRIDAVLSSCGNRSESAPVCRSRSIWEYDLTSQSDAAALTDSCSRRTEERPGFAATTAAAAPCAATTADATHAPLSQMTTALPTPPRRLGAAVWRSLAATVNSRRGRRRAPGGGECVSNAGHRTTRHRCGRPRISPGVIISSRRSHSSKYGRNSNRADGGRGGSGLRV